MSRVSPLTAQTVLAMSDARVKAARVFMADGALSADEEAALHSIDEAARMTELCDLARRIGDWVRDTGNVGELAEAVPLSRYLMTEVRELSPMEMTG